MSSSIPETFRAAVLTVSDSCARGERNDLSGPAVASSLQEHHFSIVETRVVADDHPAIQKAIVELARLLCCVGSTFCIRIVGPRRPAMSITIAITASTTFFFR